MSYIFEALQRAEIERSGGSLPTNVDSVVDLLPGVEQEIARKQALSELPPRRKWSLPRRRRLPMRKCISPVLAADSRLVCLTDQGGLAAEKFRVLGLKLRNLREQAQAQTDRGDRHGSGRRQESGRGQSGAQSVAQQDFEDALDRWRPAAAPRGQPFGL
jgi:hypothetical protein